MVTASEIPIDNRIALVADDHELFRTAISTILQRHCGFRTIIEVASLDEAVEHLGNNHMITFATFDLGMPGVSRPENLHSVRQIFPDVRAVVVAGSERRDDIFAALIAGMHGYIPKTMTTPQIEAAFQMVLEGKIFVPWSAAQLPAGIDEKIEVGDIYYSSNSSVQAKLTPRQRDVLACIRAGKSNKEIARTLGLTESTVKVHTNALYRTLGVRNRVGAASANVD